MMCCLYLGLCVAQCALGSYADAVGAVTQCADCDTAVLVAATKHYVHVNCALYSQGVFHDIPEQEEGPFAAVRRPCSTELLSRLLVPSECLLKCDLSAGLLCNVKAHFVCNVKARFVYNVTLASCAMGVFACCVM